MIWVTDRASVHNQPLGDCKKRSCDWLSSHLMGGHTCTEGKPPMGAVLHAPPEETACEVRGA